MAAVTPTEIPCGEFREFKEALQLLRTTDDKIIYRLNTSVPTISFAGEVNAHDECKSLYEQLQSGYESRKKAIQRCVDIDKQEVQRLKQENDTAGDDISLEAHKKLRSQQTKLRLMQSELTVEDVIKERSLKVFKERCWQAYKPPDL
ncbi:protein MIX23-like [Dysidea avara]|uniref:protein MIX23-like n=1 Tax=Dysidea avara TaxID=196820 RepID=UPI00332489A0